MALAIFEQQAMARRAAASRSPPTSPTPTPTSWAAASSRRRPTSASGSSRRCASTPSSGRSRRASRRFEVVPDLDMAGARGAAIAPLRSVRGGLRVSQGYRHTILYSIVAPCSQNLATEAPPHASPSPTCSPNPPPVRRVPSRARGTMNPDSSYRSTAHCRVSMERESGLDCTSNHWRRTLLKPGADGVQFPLTNALGEAAESPSSHEGLEMELPLPT